MRSTLLALLLTAPCAAHADAAFDALDDANRQARAAVARAKPNQQTALRYLAYVAWAQYHALAGAPAGREAEALRAATFAVTARLLPDGLEGPAPSAIPAAALPVLARAAGDGFDTPWSGALPSEPGAWTSLASPPRPPLLPQLGRMRTFFLARGDEFRPAAPPLPGSPAFLRDQDEVRQLSAAPDARQLAAVKKWEMTSGSLVAGHWNVQVLDLARRHNTTGRQAAAVLAMTMLATLDANIACHDAKYAFWVARPSQSDPDIRTHLGVPNHPSYPSNHACDSGAAAYVLGHFYPSALSALSAEAQEAADSRLYAGIHYRFDAVAGLDIARKVAARAIARGTGALDQVH
jgi:hypothetical protein